MSVIDEIDEMIRLRATRVPSIKQMQGWKAEIERLTNEVESLRITLLELNRSKRLLLSE